MIIGAQLYTVRKRCTTVPELEETIRRVADIGYTAVQLSGVCEYDPCRMRALLDECGLAAPLTHTSYKQIIGDTGRVIADHKTIGASYVGLGSVPEFKASGCDIAVYESFLRDVTPAIEKISGAGLKFMYHNHNMEFIRMADGGTILDDLARRFTPEQLGITLDCYWVQAGGGDPAMWLRRLAGRVDCIHLKDMVYSGADKAVRMAPVGCGNLNHEAILAASEDAGVKYAFVEQDNCYGEDELDCLRQSFEYLRACGCR